MLPAFAIYEWSAFITLHCIFFFPTKQGDLLLVCALFFLFTRLILFICSCLFLSTFVKTGLGTFRFYDSLVQLPWGADRLCERNSAPSGHEMKTLYRYTWSRCFSHSLFLVAVFFFGWLLFVLITVLPDHFIPWFYSFICVIMTVINKCCQRSSYRIELGFAFCSQHTSTQKQWTEQSHQKQKKKKKQRDKKKAKWPVQRNNDL